MQSLQSVCVVLLVLLGLLGLACQGVDGLIFRDFTSGRTFSLTRSLTAPGDADVVYHTGCGNGHLKFALYWNGDAQDVYSMAPPAKLTVNADNNDGFCGKEIGASVAFSSQTPNSCNYTASWSAPVSGVLGITYNTGDSASQASQEISIPFDNQCLH